MRKTLHSVDNEIQQLSKLYEKVGKLFISR